MKVTIERRKFLNSKPQYVASIAGWEHMAFSKETAIENLRFRLEKQAERMTAQRVEWVNGAVFILSYRDGWVYEIIRQGYTSGSLCLMGREKSYAQALEQMLNHVRQWEEANVEPVTA